MVYVNTYNVGLRHAYICQRDSSWSHTGGVGVPGLSCPLLEPAGSLCHPLELGGDLSPSHVGGSNVFAEKQLLGGSVRVRGSAPAAGVGPQVTAHVPGAVCQGREGLYLPQIMCAWGTIHYQSASWTSR